MKSRFLFPHQFKIYGWIIAIPSIILGLLILLNDFIFEFLTVKLSFKYYFTDSFMKTLNDKQVSVLNFTDEIATIGSIMGLIFIAFSRLKFEDEYVQKTRLESLQWAIYVNFAFLIIATIFIYDMAYFDVLVLNMFTPLVFFIIRFYFILFLKPRFEKN
jgi:hypothetical protein